MNVFDRIGKYRIKPDKHLPNIGKLANKVGLIVPSYSFTTNRFETRFRSLNSGEFIAGEEYFNELVQKYREEKEKIKC